MFITGHRHLCGDDGPKLAAPKKASDFQVPGRFLRQIHGLELGHTVADNHADARKEISAFLRPSKKADSTGRRLICPALFLTARLDVSPPVDALGN